MIKNKALPINCTNSGQLNNFSRMLTHVSKLQKIIDKELPSNLIGKCQAVSYRNHTLRLICHKATLSAQLRLMTPQLLIELPLSYKSFRYLKKIEVRTIYIDQEKTTSTTPPLAKWAAETANIIAQISQQCSNPKLATALRDLAASNSDKAQEV